MGLRRFKVNKGVIMMNDFRSRIEKARNKKALDKVLKEALNAYGFFSKQYGEILNLCCDRLEELN